MSRADELAQELAHEPFGGGPPSRTGPEGAVEFGKRLRAERLTRGMPARIVEEELGLGRNALYNYERGINLPTTPKLYRLLKFYGVTFEEMFSFFEEEG